MFEPLKFTLILAITLACSMVSAAEINLYRGLLQINGTIVTGDYQKILVAIVNDVEPIKNFAHGRHIFITSDGGDVIESLRIARFVSDVYATVWVVDRCNSACFLILAAAARRNMMGEGGSLPQVGLHNFYLTPIAANGLSGAKLAEPIRNVNRTARETLQEFEVPTDLIDRMISRTSSEIYNLSPGDRISLGRYRPSINQVRATKCSAKTEFERYMDHLLFRLPPPSEVPADRVTNLSSYESYTTQMTECFDRIFYDDAQRATAVHFQRMADELSKRKR